MVRAAALAPAKAGTGGGWPGVRSASRGPAAAGAGDQQEKIPPATAGDASLPYKVGGAERVTGEP